MWDELSVRVLPMFGNQVNFSIKKVLPMFQSNDSHGICTKPGPGDPILCYMRYNTANSTLGLQALQELVNQQVL